mgnify:CR=1 FL=1
MCYGDGMTQAPQNDDDPLAIRADILVAAAKAMAKPARESALAKFPFLAKFIATPEDERGILNGVPAAHGGAAGVDVNEAGFQMPTGEHSLWRTHPSIAAFDRHSGTRRGKRGVTSQS